MRNCLFFAYRYTHMYTVYMCDVCVLNCSRTHTCSQSSSRWIYCIFVTDTALLGNVALYRERDQKHTTQQDGRRETAPNIWGSVMSCGSSGYIVTLRLLRPYKVYHEFPSPPWVERNGEIHGHFTGLLVCLIKCPLEFHRCTF